MPWPLISFLIEYNIFHVVVVVVTDLGLSSVGKFALSCFLEHYNPSCCEDCISCCSLCRGKKKQRSKRELDKHKNNTRNGNRGEKGDVMKLNLLLRPAQGIL